MTGFVEPELSEKKKEGKLHSTVKNLGQPGIPQGAVPPSGLMVGTSSHAAADFWRKTAAG